MSPIPTGSVLDLSLALTAGLATFFAPCAYALLPGYVAYAMHRTEDAAAGSLAIRGIVAGLGALVALGVVVAVSVRAADVVIGAIAVVEPLVGVLIAAFGVLVLTGRTARLTIPLSLPRRRGGVAGFGLFGAGYALAAVGCVLPLFAGVIARAATLDAGAATVLLGTYVGVVVVLMIAATLAAGVGADLGVRRIGGHGDWVRRLAGLVLVAAGLGQLLIALYVPPVGV